MPQVFDNALPTPGLQAHVAVSRFVDHIPYYRQETINARSGVRTPRSTLARWSGQTGAQLMPLYDAQRDFVLSSRVLHADETPIAMLDPGRARRRRPTCGPMREGSTTSTPAWCSTSVWGEAASIDRVPRGVRGTLVVDAYSGYDKTLSLEGRNTAYCLAHSRREFDELVASSPVAAEAIRRIAWLYKIEAAARPLSADERLQMRLERSEPLWKELHLWLRLERSRVPDGAGIAKAIDYSLKHWDGLGRFLIDGDVPLDNNHCENRMRPWAVGRSNWLFIGSELAGERAAVVMSLLQSAKLCGHEPWAYLKDVLTRLPTQLNSRIEELLPHQWQAIG
ncbi:IS66 family transposase [Roseateles sp. GG27B]